VLIIILTPVNLLHLRQNQGKHTTEPNTTTNAPTDVSIDTLIDVLEWYIGPKGEVGVC
jgi:hypothetical protein